MTSASLPHTPAFGLLTFVLQLSVQILKIYEVT